MSGLIFDDDNAARGVSMFVTLVFMLVSGGLNVASNYPPVIEQLQYISPNRYALEIFFRVLSGSQKYPDFPPPYEINQDIILSELGFTFGLDECHIYLGCLFVFFMSMGWLAIYLKNRKY